MKISTEQIEVIKRTVNDGQITIATLSDDLIDHLCCVVEIKMARGQSFDEALNQAIQEVAPNGFEDIESQTLTLLNRNKTIIMKRLTYSIGFMASALLSLGWLFARLHLTGARPLLVSGYLGLFMLFLPLLAIVRYHDIFSRVMAERLKFSFGILAALLMGLSVIFGLTQWPGSDTLLVGGYIVFIIGFLPLLFFRLYKQ